MNNHGIKRPMSRREALVLTGKAAITDVDYSPYTFSVLTTTLRTIFNRLEGGLHVAT